MAVGVCCGVFLAVTALLMSILTLCLNIFIGEGQSCESGSFLCSRLASSSDPERVNITMTTSDLYNRSSSAEQKICLPQRFFCDGHPHCPNGEDENAVACSDWHGSKSMVSDHMKKMGSKSTLTVQSNAPRCSISGFPEGCYCMNETRLFCIELGLEKIPDRVTPNVSRMILANNSIRTIPREAFSRYNLELIHLEGNGLTKISPGAFSDQEILERILLNDNKLTVLEPGIFRGLKSLLWLIIYKNHLRKLSLDDWTNMHSLQWLSLSFNEITLEEESFPYMPSLKELFLNDNFIVSIKKDTFQNLSGLLLLDLCCNRIQFIHEDAFRGNPLLEELDLTYNHLSSILYGTFFGLHDLSKLWLGFNQELEVNPSIFDDLWSLSSLNLQDVEIENFNSTTFARFTKLDNIYLKSFYHCTQVTTVPMCKPNSDGVSSEEHLLVRPILRVCLWMMAFITCFGNMVVLFGRQFLLYPSSSFPQAHLSNSFPSLPVMSRCSKAEERRNHIPSLFIKNLAASDLLMGFYLCIIGMKDISFRGIFRDEARRWMASKTCSFIGILAMTSSEVSVLILICMSVERFVVIVSVFSSPLRLSPRAAHFTLGTIWALGLMMAVVPALYWVHSASGFYGMNGMCLPLHLHDDLFQPGWQYSAFVFLGVNVAAMIVIGFSYGGMLLSIVRTRHLASTSTISCDRSSADLHLALRFLLIVLTDFLCWAPVAALKASAILGKHISVDVYGWVVVFVIPFNSAINPLIYTFTAPSFQLRPLMRFLFSSLRSVFAWKHLKLRKERKQLVKYRRRVSFGVQQEQDRTGNVVLTDCSGTSTPSAKRSLEANDPIPLNQFLQS